MEPLFVGRDSPHPLAPTWMSLYRFLGCRVHKWHTPCVEKMWSEASLSTIFIHFAPPITLYLFVCVQLCAHTCGNQRSACVHSLPLCMGPRTQTQVVMLGASTLTCWAILLVLKWFFLWLETKVLQSFFLSFLAGSLLSEGQTLLFHTHRFHMPEGCGELRPEGMWWDLYLA